MPDTDVTISLTRDEALMLFDYRWEDEDSRERTESPGGTGRALEFVGRSL
jgi:hypothetical protein